MKNFEGTYQMGSKYFYRIITDHNNLYNFLNNESWICVKEPENEFYIYRDNKITLKSDINLTILNECILKCRDNYGKDIYILNNKNNAIARNAINENIYKYNKRDDFFALHCSVVNINGKGLAIIGDKDAGKSTLLAALVLWYNAKFISDDISFFEKRNSDIYAMSVFKGFNYNLDYVGYLLRGFGKVPLHQHNIEKTRIIVDENSCMLETKIDLFLQIEKQNEYQTKIYTSNDLRILKNNVINFGIEKRDLSIDKVINILEKININTVTAEFDSQVHNNISNLIDIYL